MQLSTARSWYLSKIWRNQTNWLKMCSTTLSMPIVKKWTRLRMTSMPHIRYLNSLLLTGFKSLKMTQRSKHISNSLKISNPKCSILKTPASHIWRCKTCQQCQVKHQRTLANQWMRQCISRSIENKWLCLDTRFTCILSKLVDPHLSRTKKKLQRWERNLTKSQRKNHSFKRQHLSCLIFSKIPVTIVKFSI